MKVESALPLEVRVRAKVQLHDNYEKIKPGPAVAWLMNVVWGKVIVKTGDW